jgi:hypothetical protein
VNVRSLP